ncbi:MAG: dTDP-4-dehydrorhamnose 3,5-epimerase [Rikenellaceae bacterium]|jgi:dTDP-4-dehydrorhamnose 3,5-epimerase|nr:dTDP-4-dehydrorhamnose 3,5-epimerase [Rikenellaceae bacterium]
MKITPLALPGLLLFEPAVFNDARGRFMETFRADFFEAQLGCRLVQENESTSVRGVIRGLHFQRGTAAQGKLVRVVAGEVLDVAVDLRRNSPTYGQHQIVLLSGETPQWLWIPHGFAHGFAVRSQRAVFQYKCDNYYDPAAEGGIRWNDPALVIGWGIAAPLVSERDACLPLLSESNGLTL